MAEHSNSRRLIKATGLVTLSNAASTGMGLILLMSLAWQLPPKDLAVILAVIAIIDGGQMLQDAAVNTGMVNVASKRGMQGKPDETILRAGFWFKLSLGASLAVLAAALSGPMSRGFIGDDSMTFLIISAGIAAMLAGVQSFVTGVLQAHEAFAKLALITLLKNPLRIVAVAVFLVGTPNVTGAALAICAVPVVQFGVGACMISWGFLRRSSALLPAMKALLAVNGWMSLSALAMFGGRLDLWLVGVLSTPDEAGRYALAAQICVGLGLVTQALVTTLLPTVSRFESPDQRRAFLRQWTRVLPVIILMPAGMWLVSDPLITLLFGDEYRSAAKVLNVLFLASVMTLGTAPLILILLSMDQAKIVAAGSLLQFALRVGLAIGAIPILGGLGLAWADVGSRLIAMAVIGVVILRALQTCPSAVVRPSQ